MKSLSTDYEMADPFAEEPSPRPAPAVEREPLGGGRPTCPECGREMIPTDPDYPGDAWYCQDCDAGDGRDEPDSEY